MMKMLKRCHLGDRAHEVSWGKTALVKNKKLPLAGRGEQEESKYPEVNIKTLPPQKSTTSQKYLKVQRSTSTIKF